MLSCLDNITIKNTSVIVDSKDANGKQYKNTRWLYLKDKPRKGNVFLEVWYRPIANRIDLIMYRSMMSPSENAEAILDGNKRTNDVRGMLQIEGFSQKELYKFVEQKVKIYLEKL